MPFEKNYEVFFINIFCTFLVSEKHLTDFDLFTSLIIFSMKLSHPTTHRY